MRLPSICLLQKDQQVLRLIIRCGTVPLGAILAFSIDDRLIEIDPCLLVFRFTLHLQCGPHTAVNPVVPRRPHVTTANALCGI